MSESIMKRDSIEKFISDLSSSLPAPGGGAASAMSGALGVALISMVYNLTLGKKAYDKLDECIKKQLNDNLRECEILCQEMLAYMDKDKKAFLSLIDCYKMPKETSDEKRARDNAIEECTMGTMRVPLELAKLSVKFYENIEFATKYGNNNLISDAAVSAVMLNACIESSIINVEVNLAQLDKERFAHIRKEINEIRVINEELKNKILSYTSNRIN